MKSASEFFLEAWNYCITHGFEDEINYYEKITFETCTVEHFFDEYAWCVINLGIRAQVCEREHNLFMASLNPEVVTCRFKTKKQKALRLALDHFTQWFGELKVAKDPIAYLKTLPLIGDTTKYHLARNIGIDCVKPDVHMTRLTKRFGYPSPEALCIDIKKDLPEERIGVIDLILWRYCNLVGEKAWMNEEKTPTKYSCSNKP